jgi:hypothetical protein
MNNAVLLSCACVDCHNNQGLIDIRLVRSTRLGILGSGGAGVDDTATRAGYGQRDKRAAIDVLASQVQTSRLSAELLLWPQISNTT